MPQYKGVGLTFLKKLLAEKGADVEASLYQALQPEERQLLEHIGPSDWIALDRAVSIIQKAAPVLFPDDPNQFETLGRLSARDNLTGIYKVLLGTTTMNFAVRMTSLIWGRYYDGGKAKTKNYPQDNRIEFSLHHCPYFPEVLRKTITGYLEGLAEVCQQENVSVVHDDSNPDRWTWDIFGRPAKTDKTI